MSTKSYIILEKEDGKYEGIYCHYDGFPEHHSPILLKNYNTKEKVEKLIELGAIANLGSKLEPEPQMPHTLQKPQENVVFAYHRDREEDWESNKPIVIESLDEIDQDCMIPFIYVFTENKWHYFIQNYLEDGLIEL